MTPMEAIADVAEEEADAEVLKEVPEPIPSPKLEPAPSAVTEAPAAIETPGRRSGRIARNTQALLEKKKMLLEQEEALDKAEKKIEAERKARNAARAKQLERLARASSESESSNTECVIVDEKPSAEPTAGKKTLASIFVKKAVKVQSPEEEAAKRAFLMSSAPDTVRIQVSQAQIEEDSNLPLWPGPDTCPSHVSSETDYPRHSVAGHWRYDTNLSHQEASDKPLEPGALRISSQADEAVSERCYDPLSEAEVFSLIQSKSGRVKKMFNSLMERKLEAETFEREAREKNISAAENEEKRIRGNRRRSRR